MQDDRRLERYIGRLTSEGRVDSTDARFSIDPGKLRERYATFQRADPAYCFLRIFQGLTRAAFRDVRFKLSRKTIRLEVKPKSPPVRFIEPTVLYEKLHRTELWSKEVEPFCTGILSVATECTAEFSWSYQGSALVYREGEFALDRSQDNSGLLEITLKKADKSWLPDTKKEHASLATRLNLAPPPMVVQLDSLTLTRQEEKPESGSWLSDYGQPFMLAQATAESVPGTTGVDISEALRYRPEEHKFLLLARDRLSKGSVIWLDAGLHCPGEIYPVIDGVVGELISAPRAPGMTAYIQLTGHKTDLGGLALHEPEDLVADTTALYRHILQEIRPHIQLVEPLWPDPLKVTKTLAMLALTSIEGLLLTPVLAGLAVVEGGVKVGLRQISRSSKTASFQQKLEQTIDQILAGS